MGKYIDENGYGSGVPITAEEAFNICDFCGQNTVTGKDANTEINQFGETVCAICQNQVYKDITE